MSRRTGTSGGRGRVYPIFQPSNDNGAVTQTIQTPVGPGMHIGRYRKPVVMFGCIPAGRHDSLPVHR